MEGFYYNRGVYYATIGWILTVLALTAVAIRIYSRTFLTRSTGSDDFAILLSAVSSHKTNHPWVWNAYRRQCLTLAGEIGDTLSVAHGVGRHEQLLSKGQVSQVTRWYIGDRGST